MKLATKLLAAMAMLSVAATTVHATDYVNFTGVADKVYALDWNPGNALVQGGLPVASSNPFILYYQTILGNFNGLTGNPITNNGGLNTNYEITMVAGFGELANPITPTDSKFILDTNSTTNFFKVYYDTSKNANNLEGTGFSDGTLIMSGTIINSFGVFSVDTINPNLATDNLDQFGVDDWAGKKTVSGAGATKVMVAIDSYDTNYFTTPMDTLLVELFLNTSNILPYTQVDPSKLFTAADGSLFAPNIGAINGITGPDMLFQGDANSSPIVTPEPATMVLFGAGLFGLSVFARRRKNN